MPLVFASLVVNRRSFLKGEQWASNRDGKPRRARRPTHGANGVPFVGSNHTQEYNLKVVRVVYQ